MDNMYAADYVAIEQDLTEAQSLEFDAYAGYLAHFGNRLWELAGKHEDPEAAYQQLLRHSDEFLDRLSDG